MSDSFQGEIRHQPFFKPIDFVKLEKKQIVPPYKPKLVRIYLFLDTKYNITAKYVFRKIRWMSVISTLPLLTSLSSWPQWSQIFSTNSIKFNSRDSPTQTGNILRPRADRRISAEYQLSVSCISVSSCYSFRAINIHLFVSQSVSVYFLLSILGSF